LKNCSGDSEAAEVISTANSFFDSDERAQREEFLGMIKPFRNADKYPNTYAAIRVFEIFTGWRSGQIADVPGELLKLRSPETSGFVNRTRLSYFIQNRDTPQLRKTLEALGPDEVLSDGMLPLTLKAFDLAKMDDDLALARDAAKRALYRAVLSSWADPERRYDNSLVYHLATALHDTSGIPSAWFEFIDSRLKNKRYRLFLRVDEATLREDWPRLLSIANEALQQFPTYYDLYWDKALALRKMGKPQDAVEPLKTFVRYSQNSDEYPQAKEWLEEKPAK